MISQRVFTFCCIPAEIYNDREVIQHHILTVVVVYICLRQQISDFFGCLRLCKGGGDTNMVFLWVFKIMQEGEGNTYGISLGACLRLCRGGVLRNMGRTKGRTIK